MVLGDNSSNGVVIATAVVANTTGREQIENERSPK